MCHIKSGALINFITETPHGSDVADKPFYFRTHIHAIEIWLFLWENINKLDNIPSAPPQLYPSDPEVSPACPALPHGSLF